MAGRPIDYDASVRVLDAVKRRLGAPGPAALSARLRKHARKIKVAEPPEGMSGLISKWGNRASTPNFADTMLMLSACGALDEEIERAWRGADAGASEPPPALSGEWESDEDGAAWEAMA